jgi:hypothetical protein
MLSTRKPIVWLVCSTMLLSACVSNPSQQTLSEVRSQANPTDRSSRAVTNFTPALRCMDEMMFNQGIRDITLMMEEFRDITQKLPISTRDMMTSAVSDMTRRSRAVRLSVFGSDQQNLTQFLQQAQKQSAFAVVPQYSMRGNISQLDDGVEKRGASVGLGLAERLFGVRFGTETKFSVLGFDAALVETEGMTLLPGVSSKNLTVLASRDASAGDGEAKLTNPGLDVVFSFSASRSEGTAQAARNMVELAAVELMGKLVRLPYWQCVNVSDSDPEVQREMEDWFLSMDAQELRSFLQERMRERRYFEGAIDGQESARFSEATTAYRRAMGLPPTGDMDLAFFKRFIVVPVAKGPLAALPRKSRLAAATATPPESTLATAPAPAPAPALEPAVQPVAAQLSLVAATTASRKGLALEVQSTSSGYLYCYSQDPVSQKIVRIFPNRFVRDPRIDAGKPVRLPDGQRFVLNPAAQYACLHAPREVYGDLPAPLRWGDFEEIRLKSFDEIRAHFSEVSGAHIELQRLKGIQNGVE